MGSFSIWHWMIVGVVLLLVFGGRGKISDMMGDVAKGIKSFKKGLSDDDADTATRSEAAKSIDHQATASETVRRADAESKV
jgi:sec-independent protein translocase protein TatA